MNRDPASGMSAGALDQSSKSQRGECRIKEVTVKPVIMINRLEIKLGTIDEFIETQLNYASSLSEKSTGLIGSRLTEVSTAVR